MLSEIVTDSLTVNTGGTLTTPSIGASPEALAISSGLAMLQPAVALQIPPLYQSGSHGPQFTNTYTVSTDGLFVGNVGGGNSQAWASLKVTCTDPSGASVMVQASGENSAATGTVLDQQISTLVLPIPSGSTFTINMWGGKYPAPSASAYFFPFGNGTATLQTSVAAEN